MQALGFGQEPIILSDGSWSAGLFPYFDYLGCSLLYSTFLQPDCIAEFWLFFCAWFLLSFLTLPASTLLSTMTLLVVMDWLFGPLRRDGLSSPGSPQLRRFLSRLLAARSPAGFWCRQARLIVPLDLCSSLCALGVLRGCFDCVELHACVGWVFGARPPWHIRRFQHHWPRAVKPRLVCTSDAPPQRAGSSLHV